MMSLSPNVYTSAQKYGKSMLFCDAMCMAYITYSTEWVGFFLFTTMYALYFNRKNSCNYKHLATLYREAKY